MDDEADSHKPGRQRQLGSLYHHSSSHRRLKAEAATLGELANAVCDKIVLHAKALQARTPLTIGSA
jgi:hypothetical protein